MPRWIVCLWMAAACGSVSNSTDGSVQMDARPIDGAAPDGAIDAPPTARCDPSRPFDTPVALSTLNTPQNDHIPFLSNDELTVYFASERPGGSGGFDIYVATRSSPTAAFNPPALLNGVNSADTESRPVLTADGLALYAEVKRGMNPYHIERATRSSTNASFGALSPVGELNSTSNDVAPSVLPDHSAIYFVSGRAGNEIYRAERTGNAFEPPALVSGTSIQSPDTEDYPAVSADELTLYFATNRPGGAGGTDIWVATRPSVVQGFSAPEPLAEINTTGEEWPGWISPDGCAFYFARTGSAGQDIYVAHRPL